LAIKILYVIGNLDVGGAERHLVQVLPQLSKRGHELAVYTITKKGKLAPFLEQAGVKVIEPLFASALQKLPKLVRKSVLLLFSVTSLCILLIRLRPAVVHFFLPESYLLGGLCSLVTGRHILIMSRRSLNRYQAKYPLLARLERWLHLRMHAVLGNSKAVVQELKGEGVHCDRLGLLYNGIDIAQLDGLPSRASVRADLGVEEQEVLVVCVANLIPYKGHEDLIRALSGIRRQMPGNWTVAMVGRDYGMGAQLRELAQKQGVGEHILWLGERSDAIAICAAAEIGVLCSHEEGFSNSVLEGMAAGVAMVVTDVGGNSEAVLNGESGFVVPVRNPEALGKAILSMVVDIDMRRRIAAAGHRRVADNFSLNTCVNQYADLYRLLLLDSKSHVQKALDSARGGVN
jgi:glycosyltransferase involved in cell wall biosynthesis